MDYLDSNRIELYEDLDLDLDLDIIDSNNNNNKPKWYDIFNHYYKVLGIVSIFYIIPAIQYLFLQINNDIDLEKCFFNHKCHTTVYHMYSFNNVSSNISYLILGSIFLAIVSISTRFIDNPDSIYHNKGIIISLGWSMILEGIFSSIFHLCPSETNFQFDTTFMIIFCCFMGLYLIQRRRKELVFDYYSCFLFFGLLNILNVLDLKKELIHFQWIPITILLLVTSFKITTNIYLGRLSWIDSCTQSLVLFKQWFLQPKSPDNLAIFINLIILNLVNITSLLLCNYNNFHLSTILLLITIMDNTIIICYYLFMKFYHQETIYKTNILLFILIIPTWGLSLYFYTLPTSDKSLTHLESDKLNSPCVLFNFYDTHDIWHFLSSIGMFLSLLFVWFMDWDLKNISIDEIDVF